MVKIFEHILNTIAHQQVSIDEMQFSFMAGYGITDAIFIIQQLQEKYLNKKRNATFAFMDLERAFDQVPCAVL